MDLNERKQQFSFAYVRAIAAVAGYECTKPDVDIDSIDLRIYGSSHTTRRAPSLEIQVKCQAAPAPAKDDLSFFLKKKNYEELQVETSGHRILVVVLVPEDLDKWVLHDETCLKIHRCGYWYSLLGLPDWASRDPKTIKIPRTQRFDVPALKKLIAEADQKDDEKWHAYNNVRRRDVPDNTVTLSSEEPSAPLGGEIV